LEAPTACAEVAAKWIDEEMKACGGRGRDRKDGVAEFISKAEGGKGQCLDAKFKGQDIALRYD